MRTEGRVLVLQSKTRPTRTVGRVLFFRPGERVNASTRRWQRDKLVLASTISVPREPLGAATQIGDAPIQLHVLPVHCQRP